MSNDGCVAKGLRIVEIGSSAAVAMAGMVASDGGAEVIMVLIGIAFWIGWHVIQLRQENEEVAREMQADAKGDEARDAIDRY